MNFSILLYPQFQVVVFLLASSVRMFFLFGDRRRVAQRSGHQRSCCQEWRRIVFSGRRGLPIFSDTHDYLGGEHWVHAGGEAAPFESAGLLFTSDTAGDTRHRACSGPDFSRKHTRLRSALSGKCVGAIPFGREKNAANLLKWHG